MARPARRGRGRAERLRAAGLARLAASGWYEYFEPTTGGPLGSPDQYWTAAVALDWLTAASSDGMRSEGI